MCRGQPLYRCGEDPIAVCDAESPSTPVSKKRRRRTRKVHQRQAIVWTAALGLECAAQAALVARLLTPPGGLRYAIRRIAESSKATTKFDDATATKFLMHPLLSGFTNWPRLEKG